MQIRNNKRTWVAVTAIMAAVGLGRADMGMIEGSSRPPGAQYQERLSQSSDTRDKDGDEPRDDRTAPVFDDAREGDWLTTRLWEYVCAG